MSNSEKKYPKGYWMSVGLSIGVAIGVILWPLFENIGIGIAIGIAIGSGIGASLEQRNKDNIRPLTEQERAREKRSIIIGLTVAFILGVLLAVIYFLQSR